MAHPYLRTDTIYLMLVTEAIQFIVFTCLFSRSMQGYRHPFNFALGIKRQELSFSPLSLYVSNKLNGSRVCMYLQLN